MPKKFMNLDKINKIHFIGIGGIGLSALAKMMVLLGKKVSGSDLLSSAITERLRAQGAKISIGHQASNLPKNVDLAVYSAAVPLNNIEILETKKLKVPLLSYAELLGQISVGKKTVAVTGTNGKTTTTGILGKVLIDCGLDPMLLIGGQLKQIDGNFHLGQGKYFVTEADEYKATMLKIKPWSVLLTSIEKDHLDFYKDLPDIIRHFQLFIDKIPAGGQLFYNADDRNVTKIVLPPLAFGCSLKNPSDYMAKNIIISKGQYHFNVYNKKKFLGDFTLPIPGQYNILNSLMVIGFCHQLGIDLGKVNQSLANFGGLWRRFEVLGQLKNAADVTVVSDYTHHPSAIKKTLKAAKEFFPVRRLFLVYQPHQHDRTRKLYRSFLSCFNKADFIILQEIYDVAGRKYQSDKAITSKSLVNDIVKTGNKKRSAIVYSPDFPATKKLIYQNVLPGDLLLIMGAGDLDDLARTIYVRTAKKN